MSHLLHPPLLDEAGLSSALRWYIEGFAERSKISVNLEIDGDIGRLPREFETAVFRVVQECLTNIHRHAHSLSAAISIARKPSELRLEIEGAGIGIPLAKRTELELPGKAGVGIRGMRERLRQWDGSLEIAGRKDGRGTIVIARLLLCRGVPHVTGDAHTASGSSPSR
jgi:two-component system, NarL family, sensor kinase